MLEILNLGAGVQSSTLLLMSIRGELPKLDGAIFADTGWEPRAVYDWLTTLEATAAEVGIPVYRTAQSDIKQDALRFQVRGDGRGDGERWGSMPLFVLQPDGSKGMVRRQCTYEYKIRAIDKFTRRELLRLSSGQKSPRDSVRRWFGISTDEMQRMRSSDERYAVNWYPLIERRMSRVSCYDWLQDNEYPIPPRSACIGCPYRSDAEWRWLRDNSPDEFEEACQFDEAIRQPAGMRGECFLHAQRIPLREVDLTTDVDKGQLLLWQDECEGMCGV